MLCSALSILFINSYSQDTTCTMVRPHEVVEFNYSTDKVISRYDNKKLTIIEVGYQEILWDSKDINDNLVSSGVYFYTITAGDYTALKKMVLMK